MKRGVVIAVVVVGTIGLLGTCAYKLGEKAQEVLTEEMTTENLSPEHLAYAGKWQSEGGLSLQIYENGKGDYEGGGMTVTGGKVLFEGNRLSLRFMNIGPVFQIDQAPENGEMVLDGIRYKKVPLN